ncbi:MFS transporter [Dictyobacter alpinus]|uniref:MFS transporter n=1 Tax=Dictyobacter alpinus TaxID=2014873 RepID=A0A402B8E0_9CHLR|nr:MFS transporter [Dictyobacter alpinus]GCE27618.1 MFS transporter [Dictyobacter alpinus]
MLATLRQRNFTLLWLGSLISLTGDWLLRIGLPIYIYILTGSALQTGIMFIAGNIPMLFSSFAGVLVDRWDRRRTMIVCTLLQAVGLLPLLLVHNQNSLWIIYTVQFLEACLSLVTLPAESALIPLLVSEDLLIPANALRSVSQNASRLLGAAAGGLLVGILGLGGIALVDSLSFLFVGLMLVLIRMAALPQAEHAPPSTIPLYWKSLFQEWREGIQLIFQQRALKVIVLVIALQSIGEGVFGVLIVVFVEHVLGYGASVYGFLSSIQAIGSLAGGVLIGNLGNRFAPAKLLGICLALFGLIDLIIIDIPFVLPGLFIIGLLFALVGIPGTGIVVGANSLLQTLVENKIRGRVFGAFLAIEGLASLAGMGLASLFGDRLGATLMLNIQGSVYILAGLLVLVNLAFLSTTYSLATNK